MMKYAVYVKFENQNGEEEWSGNAGRRDESREEAERLTVEAIKLQCNPNRILKVISFEYESEEQAPSFVRETRRADMEERKDLALVEIADALKGMNFGGQSSSYESSILLKWVLLTSLGTQLLTLLLLILRML